MSASLGKVIDGKVVDDASLEEGATVTGGDEFELDEAAEAEMLAALAEADRGVFVDGEGLLRALRSRL